MKRCGCDGCHYDSPDHPEEVKINQDVPNASNILRFPNELPEDVKKHITQLDHNIHMDTEDLHIPDDCDTHFCLRCGKGVPVYCESCVQELLAANMSLQEQLSHSIPKNLSMEIFDAIRNILTNGNRPDLQVDELKNIYILYSKEILGNE